MIAALILTISKFCNWCIFFKVWLFHTKIDRNNNSVQIFDANYLNLNHSFEFKIYFDRVLCALISMECSFNAIVHADSFKEAIFFKEWYVGFTTVPFKPVSEYQRGRSHCFSQVPTLSLQLWIIISLFRKSRIEKNLRISHLTLICLAYRCTSEIPLQKRVSWNHLQRAEFNKQILKIVRSRKRPFMKKQMVKLK